MKHILVFLIFAWYVKANLQKDKPYKTAKHRYVTSSYIEPTCFRNKTGPLPDVFWINLDKSYDRRKEFELELSTVGLLRDASRIRALTPNMVVVPEQLKLPHECKVVDSKDYLTWPEVRTKPHPISILPLVQFHSFIDF
jgi:hypothetical protein